MNSPCHSKYFCCVKRRNITQSFIFFLRPRKMVLYQLYFKTSTVRTRIKFNRKHRRKKGPCSMKTFPFSKEALEIIFLFIILWFYAKWSNKFDKWSQVYIHLERRSPGSLQICTTVHYRSRLVDGTHSSSMMCLPR